MPVSGLAKVLKKRCRLPEIFGSSMGSPLGRYDIVYLEDGEWRLLCKQVVYMTGSLGMKTPDAESSFHVFTGSCYLLPVAGAWIADNLFGKYPVILYLSVVYCAGKLRFCIGFPALTENVMYEHMRLLCWYFL